MTWFTADWHYNHENIIKYCNRPFDTLKDMNETILNNYNSLVNPSETTYFLGDLIFLRGHSNWQRELEILFGNMNGRIECILGNHDYQQHFHWAKKRGLIRSYQNLLDIKIDKQPITLCHYRMMRWNKSHYGAWHLFAHSHGTLPDIRFFQTPGWTNEQYLQYASKTLDVGVDTWYFKPVSFDEVKGLLSEN
jgi:calcineurin-like phosphoesterase family protein